MYVKLYLLNCTGQTCNADVVLNFMDMYTPVRRHSQNRVIRNATFYM